MIKQLRYVNRIANSFDSDVKDKLTNLISKHSEDYEVVPYSSITEKYDVAIEDQVIIDYLLARNIRPSKFMGVLYDRVKDKYVPDVLIIEKPKNSNI